MRQAGYTVGEAGAALVEDHEAAERGEASIETLKRRLFPSVLKVRDKAWREDQVEESITDYLIRDVDVAALCVACLRALHVGSFQPESNCEQTPVTSDGDAPAVTVHNTSQPAAATLARNERAELLPLPRV